MTFTSNYGLLNIPDQWNEYFSKYPNGYTILEAVINWAGQVNDMVGTLNSTTDYVNNFMSTFDTNLDTTTKNTLTTWLNDGTLANIINQTIFDNLNADLQARGVNVMNPPAPYVAPKGDGTTDDTSAIQGLADNYAFLLFPAGKTFRVTSTLHVKQPYSTWIGSGQLYGGSQIKYEGTGTPIVVDAPVLYFTVKNLQVKGTPSVTTDYYNSGTIGIDVTSGSNIEAEGLWVQNFETCVKSNYNSFYNKFHKCRFEQFLTGLSQFSVNNLPISECRFTKFNVAITANGGDGTLHVHDNSFEVFNGAIINMTGQEQGIVIFEDNYVEIYDQTDLPTNFPNMQANGALVGKFGGNILFTGPYGTLKLLNNDLNICGVFRITTLASCDHFVSENNIRMYTTGNNLDRLYGMPATAVKTYYIKDRLGAGQGSGAYTRTYSQPQIALSKPFNDHYFYDCVQDKNLMSSSTLYTPTLLNGWTAPDAAGYGVPKILVTKEGLYLQGEVDGTNHTDIVLFTIPSQYLPYLNSAVASPRGYGTCTAFSANGGGSIVRFRFLYTSGDFRFESGASTTAINLDGLFIPFRT